jgi:hypothetical protein
MTRRHAALALLGITLLTGCSTGLCQIRLTPVGVLQQRLEEDLAKLPEDRAGVQRRLAALAKEAQSEAQGEQNPQNKVALYRIAAVAAWQAGPASRSDIAVIAGDGAAACDALPAGQQRPTDCAIIALAKPFAVADALQLRLRALVGQLDQLDAAHAQRCATLTGTQRQDCVAEVVKLPASDRPEVLQLFSGFETQFKDARDVAHNMGDVGAGLSDAAKNGQVILYCNAEKTWLVSKRVDGMKQDRDTLTCRRKRLDCLLTRSDAECADPCPSDENNPVVDCQELAGRPLPLPVQPAAPPS